MQNTQLLTCALFVALSACSGSVPSQSTANGDAGATGGSASGTGGGSNTSQAGAPNTGGAKNSSGGMTGLGGSTVSHTGGSPATGGVSNTGGVVTATGATSATGGSKSTGGVAATGGVVNTGGTSSGATGGASVILYGTPYSNVNMWLGPVDFAESQYHNACGLDDGSIYPTAIQNLYGNYIIGLDGGNIPNVFSHCDNCAQLTANGKTLIARIVTYGTENGTYAIDLSPQAQSALGLSSSNWTGTWQYSSCPTNGTPIYYEFDSRQWNPQNFWYMRIWVRNQRLPVTSLETKIGSSAWASATQQSDGAWQTPSGVDFSSGFQVRVTAVDSQQLVDTVPAPTGLNPATPIAGQKNFQ